MNKFRAIIFIFIFILITSTLSYIFIKYREYYESRSQSRDYQISKKLFSQKGDIGEKAAVFDIYGNEIFEVICTTCDDMGNITEVTKYETLKDENGNDVKVILNKRVQVNSDLTSVQYWGIKKPSRMITKYYEGEIKKINEDYIIFFVKNESDFIEFDEHIVNSIKIKPYEKIIKIKDYNINDPKGPFLPADTISMGYRLIYNFNELQEYLGKYIYMQESFTTFYEGSPLVKSLSFKELF